MAWPQIAIIVLICLDIGMALGKHGEPRDGNYSVFSTAISTAIVAGILYAGGFFD